MPVMCPRLTATTLNADNTTSTKVLYDPPTTPLPS